MSFSVLDYYVSLRHEQSVNFIYHLLFFMVNSVHYNFYLSITSMSGSLSNVCGYVLALFVRRLGIGYLVVEDGIHYDYKMTYEEKCICIKLKKRMCIFGAYQYFRNNLTIKLFTYMCLKSFIITCLKFGSDCSLRIT